MRKGVRNLRENGRDKQSKKERDKDRQREMKIDGER